MVEHREYIMVRRNDYPMDHTRPFLIAIADGTVYGSRDVTAAQLQKIRRDINDVLGEGMVEMTLADLWGKPNYDDMF